jgi:NAD(P)-dependent dehydrogenase (short-subunit alcohol dehydrogenase family)
VVDTRLIFEVNTLSHYWLGRGFLPSMIKKSHGMVVTVASQAAYVVTANMVDYSGSKSATVAFHEGLATELKTGTTPPRCAPSWSPRSSPRRTSPMSNELSAEDTWFNPLLELETVAELLVQQVS